MSGVADIVLTEADIPGASLKEPQKYTMLLLLSGGFYVEECKFLLAKCQT